jgi:asparagine N-glycosylation enzyme membrane subunit Stt3
VHLRKLLVVGVHLLLVPIAMAMHGRANGGVIIAGIQVVLVTVLAGALSAVADVEEAAGSDTEADDDEG